MLFIFKWHSDVFKGQSKFLEYSVYFVLICSQIYDKQRKLKYMRKDMRISTELAIVCSIRVHSQSRIAEIQYKIVNISTTQNWKNYCFDTFAFHFHFYPLKLAYRNKSLLVVELFCLPNSNKCKITLLSVILHFVILAWWLDGFAPSLSSSCGWTLYFTGDCVCARILAPS